MDSANYRQGQRVNPYDSDLPCIFEDGFMANSIGETEDLENDPRSPRIVRSAFNRGDLIGTGMDIGNSRSGLQRVEQDLFGFRMPAPILRDGIDRNRGKVFRLDKITERRWAGLFVQRILLDGIPHDEEVLLERSFLGALD